MEKLECDEKERRKLMYEEVTSEAPLATPFTPTLCSLSF